MRDIDSSAVPFVTENCAVCMYELYAETTHCVYKITFHVVCLENECGVGS